MSVLAFHYEGYAGFSKPIEVVDDPVLSPAQKIETLHHWQRAVTRMAHRTGPRRRATYDGILAELASAIGQMEDKVA
jgi:hypothetical protein